MLLQPTNNKINRHLLHSPQYRHLQMANGYNKVANSRIIAAHSPQHKVITQPQRVNMSPTHHYMMHLIPQQPIMVSPVTIINPTAQVVRSESQSLVNKIINQKTTPLTQSVLTLQRPQVILNTNSTGFFSRGTSELSNKKSKVTNGRNEYTIPQSPNNLRKMQPVRRVSQHKLNISTTDHQGQQQQNIRIIIQTDSPNQSLNTPSKITIQHTQGVNNNQIIATNGTFIITGQAQSQAQNLPLINQNTPKITHINENKLNGSTNLPENNVINSPTYSQIAQTVNEQRTKNRGYSYSMDSKHLQKQIQNRVQIIEQLKSSHQASSPQIIILDPPSDLFIDKKPISFSIKQNSQLMDSQSSKKQQIYQGEKQQQQEGISKRDKNKLSIQSSKANFEQRKKMIKQVYNEYYDQTDQMPQNSIKEAPIRRNYLIYDQQKTYLASSLLLNQIYQNEVHKALLRMNLVQNRSHQKSIKRRKF